MNNERKADKGAGRNTDGYSPRKRTGTRRGGTGPGWHTAYKVAAALLILAVIILAVRLFSLNQKTKQLFLENESLKLEASAGAVKTDGPKDAGEAENASQSEDTQSSQAQTTEPVTTEAQTAEPETTTAPAETKKTKLETLDGVAAGTVVMAEELDLENLSSYFQAYEIKTTGNCYQRINGKSYVENPNVGLKDIRYIKVLHYNFNHERQVGEIIVNKGLADDVLSVFRELYDAEYEIQSMHLVDNYWTGDGTTSDSASIDENNTSAFNYRPATGGKKLSNHAYGFAIDINPQQNPYVSYSSGKPKWSHENANDYIDRSSGLPHVITKEDKAYKIFTAHGFKWGGDWNSPKDYQHFEKKLY